MTVKTRINPDTGMMETYGWQADDGLLAKKIAADRKVLRDMLDGNIQFHDDPNTPPKPQVESPVDPNVYDYYGYP
jgi:hypothetical protein